VEGTGVEGGIWMALALSGVNVRSVPVARHLKTNLEGF